jgi:hypothetical protein
MFDLCANGLAYFFGMSVRMEECFTVVTPQERERPVLLQNPKVLAKSIGPSKRETSTFDGPIQFILQTYFTLVKMSICL